MNVDMEVIMKIAQESAENTWASGEEVTVQFQTYNDGQVTFFAIPHTPDRENWAKAIRVLATMITSDAMLMVSDTYHSRSQHKTDGTAWSEGEMEYAFTHDTVDKHLVTEALMTVLVDRLGNGSASTLPYVRTGTTVEWGEAEHLIEGNERDNFRMGGLLADAMRHDMTEPTLFDQVIRSAPGFVEREFGMSEKQAHAHLIAVAVKLLHSLKFSTMVPFDDEEEAEIVRSSLENGPEFPWPSDA